MKKFLATVLSCAVVAGSITAPASVLAKSSDTAELIASDNRIAAFKGAEGGGMWTTGARAALENGEKMEVYHVTTLADSGEGSFRDAVSRGNRIVVFDVSGYIDLSSNVSIGHDNMTILGQTSPGGVCFRTNNIKVGANNVILRHLRFRVGAHDANGNDTRTQDGLEVTDNCQNIIIDHCSVSWGTDENMTAYAVKDMTIQNSIIAEGLNQSIHAKGEHSYAGIWGGVNLSVHHNLIANHKSRNPKVGTSETVAMTEGYTDDQTLVDMKNNVIYNWGDKAGYGTENGAKTFIQNNIYRPGPATPNGKRARIFELSVGQKYQTNMFGSVYAKGNKIDVEQGDPDYKNAQIVNENNWQDDLGIGVYTDRKFYALGDKTNIKLETPTEAYLAYEAEYPITLDATDDVYEKVLANAGATLPKRDAVDERIIENVRTRTAPNGSNGSKGLLDDPVDGIPEGATGYDGRGYPELSGETRAADFDADKDGIADAWEDAHGLNKDNPLDSTMIGPEGYTWLEIYVEDEITKSEYADGLDITLNANTETELSADTTLSATGLGANVTEVEFYCDGTLLGKAEKNGDSAALTTKDIVAGTRYITAVAKDANGHSNVSNTVLVNCYNKSDSAAVESWTGKNSSVSNGQYIIGADGSLSQNVSGDFDFVAELDELGVTGANSEIKFYVGDNSISYGYENYALKIKANSADVAGVDYDDYKLFKLSRVGNDLKLYIGKNLADWAEVGSATLSDASAALKVEATGGVGILNILRVITSDMKTAPKAVISNITENQRLNFTENIDVAITPDSKAGVSEVYVYLTENGTDKLLASYKANEPITENTTITIPVSFTTVTRGSIKVLCMDVNLGTSTDAKNVVVSQDITPWKIADIGSAETDEKTYVAATLDYTFKISSSTGKIGGKSDEFGYMYQEFTGDNRLYYRSRMQSGKQFGVVIKPDLDADGITYYFGGNMVNGERKYQLMARTAKGAEMTVVEDLGGGSANLFYIVEKVGDTMNIYKTENGSTIYTTKELLASIKLDGIGDTYYMGYGAAYDTAYANPSDAGWVGIDRIQSDGRSYTWNFDNGLDWLWQMQERNVLEPKFEAEAVAGNSTGKLLLAPDENYTGERYVFHEYIMEDKYMPKMNADVFLNGDSPAMNVYFQTGSLDEAYKVTFANDGNIYANAGTEITDADTALGAWTIGNWYNVEIATVLDETTNYEPQCRLVVKDSTGTTVASLDNMPLSGSGKFRTQINTEKKYNVTKAVYFEPLSAAKGSYYIDNVEVTAVKGRYEVNKTENMLTFTDDAEGEIADKTYDNGFVVKKLTVSGKNKTIVDEGFSKRVQMDKGNATTDAIIIPTGISGSGTCEIQVYAEQGGSSGERYMVLTDGTKELTRLLIGATNRFDYTYTGSAENLVAYSTSKIYVYGVKVVKTTIIDTEGGTTPDPTKATAITGYNVETGEVNITLGDDVPSSITVVVAGYDANGVLINAVNSGKVSATAETSTTVITPAISGAASYKVFVFDSMDSISPLCESVKY